MSLVNNHITFFHILLLQSETEDISKYDISIYLRFKSFKNSTIYDHNTRSTAKLFDEPVRKISRSIKKLIRIGYLREHHGNLTAVSKHKILSRKLGYVPKKGWVPIDTRDTKYIRKQLEYHIIANNNSQQVWAITRKKKEILKTRGRSNPKDKATVVTLNLLNRNFFSTPLHSTRGIGRLLGVSHTKAAQILKELERLGMIKTERIKEERIRNFMPGQKGPGMTIQPHLHHEKGHVYVKDGDLMIDRGTKINFISCSSPLYNYPIKRISIYTVYNRIRKGA